MLVGRSEPMASLSASSKCRQALIRSFIKRWDTKRQ
jgi:hypothetical protein